MIPARSVSYASVTVNVHCTKVINLSVDTLGVIINWFVTDVTSTESLITMAAPDSRMAISVRQTGVANNS